MTAGNTGKDCSERISDAVNKSEEDGIADTGPDYVGTPIDENETSTAAPINWAAHHRQRAEMLSKRTAQPPSALKTSQSYREPSRGADVSTVTTKEELAPHRRRGTLVSTRKDNLPSTLEERESQSNLAANGEGNSSMVAEGDAIPGRCQRDLFAQGNNDSGSAPRDSRQTTREAASKSLPSATSSRNATSINIVKGNVSAHFPANRKSKPNAFNVSMYSPSDSDKPIENEDGVAMSGIHCFVRNESIPRGKPCPCGSGKKFKKCCMLAIKKEAEELYGDLDELVERIGLVCLDLDNSTRKLYAQEDAKKEAKARAEQAQKDSEDRAEASVQAKVSKDTRENQTPGGFNITYTAGGHPIALDEPCPCGEETDFVKCCMPKLNKEAEEQRGDELAMLRRQKRTVDLVLAILDETKSPEPSRIASEQSRPYTPQADLIAAHPGPGPESFTSRHVSLPSCPFANH